MLRTTFNAWACCLVAASCMSLYGYDAASFNSVQGYKEFVNHFKAHPEDKKINVNILGAVNTAYTCGGIIAGYFITPTFSSVFGRRITMFTGCLIVIAASIEQTFSPNMTAFIIGRLFVGIGQGFVLPTGPTYIAEVAPAHVRGKIMSFWQVMFTIGAFIVYWIAYGTNKTTANLGLWRYRIILILQCFIPGIICCFIFTCPESPRWLVEHNKIAKARAAIAHVRPAEAVDPELEEIVAAVNYEKATINKGHSFLTPYKVIWTDPSVRRRFIYALVINCGQQINGNGSLGAYSTLIYQQIFANPNTTFTINAVFGCLAILFTLNCTWLVDRVGRKQLLVWGALGQGLILILVTIVGTTTPIDKDGHRPFSVGVAIVFLIMVFAIFYKPSWGATVWIYTGEIFSTNVRAHAVAMATQFQSVSSAVVNQIFPLFLQAAHFYTFIFFACVNVALAAFCWFILPETKGVPLEEMDTLFGGKSHRHEGKALTDEEVVAHDGVKRTEVEDVETKALPDTEIVMPLSHNSIAEDVKAEEGRIETVHKS